MHKFLLKGKNFICNCPRCADPTEFGTFGSSLVCQKCKSKKKESKLTKDDEKGLIMAFKTDSNRNSDERKSIVENVFIWKCNLCGIEKSEKEVETLCAILHQKCEDLINRIPDENSICDYEVFIKKYSGTLLHPNHMFLTNLKYSLSGFYGRLEGYQMHQMDETALLRKKQVCEEALHVLNKLDPGISPRRGLLCLYFTLTLV